MPEALDNNRGDRLNDFLATKESLGKILSVMVRELTLATVKLQR